MQDNNLLRIGIAHGDINGIGYEMIIKLFEDVRIFESFIPVVYGSSKILAYHRKAMNLTAVNLNTITSAREAGPTRVNIINCDNEDTVVEFSKPTPEAESMARYAIERALTDLSNSAIDALVLAPSTVDEASLLSASSRNQTPLRILVHDSLRIALLSEAIPLSEVSGQLTRDAIFNSLQTLNNSLLRDFTLSLPRIAVLSFNPGMGVKEQKFGREETDIIIPAIKKAGDAGITCFGPYSADDFFGHDEFRKFDAVLATYYDQAVVPFRSASHCEGASYFAGLPFVVATPDIGVSFARAGKNECSEAPLRNAIYLAHDLVEARRLDRELRANPLKKQYFEKGSDNEKLDLTKEDL